MITSAVMLAAAVTVFVALSRRKWLFALLAGLILAGLLWLTPDGHAAVAALVVFGTEVAR